MKQEPYREAPYARRAYVLGHPIGHSLSPALHRAAYRYVGDDDLEYQRRDTVREDLPGIFAEVNHPAGTPEAPYIAGLSVTMPLKTAVIEYCDELTELARITGAVNTVYVNGLKVIGHNTDVAGIVNALLQAGLDPAPQRERPAVVGGGATAISALTALHRLGYGGVDLYARSLHKLADVHAVADRLGVQVTPQPLAQFPAAVSAYNPVISTLPARAADAWAQDMGELTAGSLLLDVAYDPWPSLLASEWEKRGGTVVSGLEMLLYQAVEQVLIFTRRTPDDTEKLGMLNAMCAAVGLAPREHLPQTFV